MRTGPNDGGAVLIIPQGSLGTKHSVCNVLNMKSLVWLQHTAKREAVVILFFPLLNEHLSSLPGLLVRAKRLIVINDLQVSG